MEANCCSILLRIISRKELPAFRKLCTQPRSSYYVTTPIYYVNAKPHIGHLYSSLIADASQRWHRMRHRQKIIKFSTGTDEHGSKIQQAASNNGISLPTYCEMISKEYKNLANLYNINYTNFIRTSDEIHSTTIDIFWEKLKASGNIYSADYEGWYCVSDETFLTDSQLMKTDNRLVSAESGHPVEWTKENNYIFSLSSYQEELKYWLTQNENIVKPKKFHKILLDMISKEVLPDVSISRPSSRVHWGIRVPGDETQTIYVWLDALVNYLTVAGYANSSDGQFSSVWPPDVQVIGKDILKFHGIYWPAFLMAAKLELPRCLLCHSHWTVDGEKMSKSKNNVVCPINRSQLYTVDGMRYFLLREGVAHSDGNYSDTKVIRILNSELADTLGNLLSRCSGTALNPNQEFPEIELAAFQSVSAVDVTKRLIENVRLLPDTCKNHYEEFNYYKAVDAIVSTLHSANLFFEVLKPWELKKKSDLKKLDVVLHITLESIRVTASLLQPIVPTIADTILNKLNISKTERYFDNLQKLSWDDTNFVKKSLSSDSSVIFRRILTEDTRKTKMKM